MLLSEVFINRTKGYRFGDSEPQEAFTDNIGKLFRSCQREYGRCSGRMYVDQVGREAAPIGWVFEKRVRYEDARENGVRDVT